jgi:hypothetical protein
MAPAEPEESPADTEDSRPQALAAGRDVDFELAMAGRQERVGRQQQFHITARRAVQLEDEYRFRAVRPDARRLRR